MLSISYFDKRFDELQAVLATNEDVVALKEVIMVQEKN